MKYYIEYKDREEFNTLCKHYKETWGYVAPSTYDIPPGFIIENDVLDWKNSTLNPPTDAKKITFQEWKEMVHLENKLNSKLEWKLGAYVKYLGTKQEQNSGKDWEKYFNRPGLKAGDVGIITTIRHDEKCWINDKIRSNSNGVFSKNDLQLITKEEYEAGLRDSNVKINTTTPTQYVSMEMFLANPHNYHFCLTKQEEVDAVFNYLESLQEKIDRKSIVFIPESWSYIVYKSNKWRINNRPNGDSKLMNHEEFLKCRPKTYEFNEGDLVVMTSLDGKSDCSPISWINVGEIIKLGGRYWSITALEEVNNFQDIVAISASSRNGNSLGLKREKNGCQFRHCTPEEITHYNKVGIGANINNMKKPFNIDTYVPKGELKGIPNDIIKVMLQHQVEQGNPEDVTIFENYKRQGKIAGGFDWDKTPNPDIWRDVLGSMNFRSFYNFYKPKSDLPFKIGDEVTILSKPSTWTDAIGGKCGPHEVKYPYTFTVKNIAKCGICSLDKYIAIFDGTYGWTYYKDIFVKAEPKEDDSWKIAVKTDDKRNNRPHMIDYLLSLHKDATNEKTVGGCHKNVYYYLTKDNNDSKPYITTSCKLPKGYKVIEEKDLPNYPKTETFEVPHDSPLDLKFVVKSSMNVLKLLDKVKGYEHHYENYGFGYKYINYPYCDGSHLCDSIPSGYVEISEHEAIDRLTSIINGTFLIRTRPSVHSDVSNGNPDTYSNTIVSTKKQSLTEQLCKIIKKEPVNTPVTSLFPTKRKSIINKLKF